VKLRRLARLEILIPLLAILARLVSGPRTVDDAYITFRYSRNLLSGLGLVYNPGEWVLGTTTPLYAGVMALLGLFSGGPQAPFPYLALILNSVADAISCYLLLQFGKRLGSVFAGSLTAFYWALSPMSVTFAIGGMETSIYVLLMLATLYLEMTNRPILAAFLGGLCLLTRPDALLFILPLMVERLRQLWLKSPTRPSWAELLAFLLPITPWVIIASLAYGQPIPHSILAKVGAYQLPPEAAFVRLLQNYATPFMGNLLLGRLWIGIGLLLLPALSIAGWLQVIRKHHDLWPLAAFPWIYLAAFSLANPLIFRWYLTPPLPIYVLGITIGLAGLTANPKVRIVRLALSALIIVFTLNAWTLTPDHGPQRPAPKMAYIKLEQLYIQVAEQLQGEVKHGDVLAAGDIGALGYFTNAEILDTVGLVSPITLDYLPIPASYYVINYAIPPELILDQMPDYLVILEVYGREGLLRNPRFNQLYQLTESYPTDIYGSRAMLVFKLRRPETD
jgi:arabinofuranosyltransferase